MKKYINKMTRAELTKLLKDNKRIRNRVYDEAWENAGIWLNDYLRDCPADYHINLCYDSFVITEDNYGGACFQYSNFEKWFDDVQKNWGFISVENEKIIRSFLRYAEIAYKLEYEVCAKPKDEEYVYKKTNELKEQAERIFLCRCQAEYEACDDDSILIDVIDNMVENSEFDNMFILDGDYSKVYEHCCGYYVKARDEIVA